VVGCGAVGGNMVGGEIGFGSKAQLALMEKRRSISQLDL